jgi:hypothetical protein
MMWQLGIVAVVVALAAGYLVRQTWRAWSARKDGCGGSCGCGGEGAAIDAGKTLIPLEQIRVRRPGHS